MIVFASGEDPLEFGADAFGLKDEDVTCVCK